MTLQIKQNRRLGRVLLLFGIYIFLLLLSYGFPVTGDDWYFTPREGWQGLYQAYRHGYSLLVIHALSFNGRYIGSFLAGFFCSSRALCLIFTCLVILLVILTVQRFCQIKRLYACWVSAVMVICLPASLYSQTYAWSAGFFNYVPSALLALLFFCMVSRHYAAEKPDRGRVWTALPALLLGFATQFFAENISIGMCLLSAAVLLYFCKTKRFAWKFAGYLVGAVLGCALMFLAPGYRHIGTDADTYRAMANSLSSVLTLVRQSAHQISLDLFGKNFLLVLPLTFFCVALLRPLGRPLRRREIVLLVCLMLPPAYFAANQLVLQELYEAWGVLLFAAMLQRVMSVLYFAGLLWCVLKYVREEKLKFHLLLLLAGIVAVSAPLLVVSPVTSRCVYLPHILMVCMVLLLGKHFMQAYPNAERFLRVPLVVLGAVMLTCYLWISVWNGHTQATRVSYTKELMAQGAAQITLPAYPYEDYVFGMSSEAIIYYYYYDSPGDITFELLPYESWERDSAYASDMAASAQ